MDGRIANNGYFTLQGYLDLTQINWKNENLNVIINAPRNIGKSVGIIDYFIFPEIWEKSNYDHKVIFLRYNQARLDQWKTDMIDKYGEKIRIDSKYVIYLRKFDENGKELFQDEKIIGYGVGLNNASKVLSGRFENVRMIFWDEYNELATFLDVYQKWIMLFKTVERFNKPFLSVLSGNKNDGVNNDILINLGIDGEDMEEMGKDGEDVILKITKSIFYIDIANDTFSHLKNNDTSANEWASLNSTTNEYLNNGGYLVKCPSNVLVYDRKVAPTKYIKSIFSMRGRLFEYGSFINKNKECFYFHEIQENNTNLPTIAFDLQSDMEYKEATKFWDEENYQNLALHLKHQIKNKCLYFTSYNAKLILEGYILAVIDMYYR